LWFLLAIPFDDASVDNNLKRKRDGEKKPQDPKLQEYLSLMGSSVFLSLPFSGVKASPECPLVPAQAG
jgi:hypothetical protein